MLPPPLPTYAAPMAAVAAPMPVPLAAAPIPVASFPGYPVPVVAPAQGYPGPAVAAAPVPLPVAAPVAPVPVAQPQPFPVAYAAPTPQAQAQSMGDIGAAIANATGGDRAPQLAAGFNYVVEVLESRVTKHPVEMKLTFIADLKIVQSNNPAQPAGAEVAYIEGLQYGGARVREFLISGVGFPSQAELESAYRAQGQEPSIAIAALANAAANPATTPLKGRRLNVSAMTVTRIPKSGKNQGRPTDYLSLTWSPAA